MKDKCVDFVLMISIVFSDKYPASPGSGLTLTPGPPVCGDCSQCSKKLQLTIYNILEPPDLLLLQFVKTKQRLLL